jgi:hypothetical protein
MQPEAGGDSNSSAVPRHTQPDCPNVNMSAEDDMVGEGMAWKTILYKRKLDDANAQHSATKRTQMNNTAQTGKTRVKLNDPRLILDIPVQNKFSALSQPETVTAESQSPKLERPPPIFLKSQIDYLPFCRLLKTIVGEDFKCVSTTKGVTLYLPTPEKYRTCVKFLGDQQADFHSYQLSEDKPYRIVIRGLHFSVMPEAIMAELNSKGHTVRSVTNVISRNKEMLPLHFVDLEPNVNNSEILDLNYLLHSKIKVEPPRPRRHLLQCMRCQDFGHTKKYCHHPPRCVRCGQGHHSSTCQKPRDVPATCALCASSHPANYRGCTVYKDLQNNRKPAPLPKRVPQAQPPNFNNVKTFPPLQRSQGHTAAAAPGYSYASTTRRSFPETRNSSSPESPSSSDNISQLSIFITEMRNMLTPVITLITQLIQVLGMQHAQ